MRAVIIGAVDSSRVALQAIARAPGWELAAVVTLRDDLSSRHSDFVDLSPHAAVANARLLPVDNINTPDSTARIRAANPDFIFVVGWSQICGPDFMAIAPGAVIGYHPTALPRMRGRAALPWTILNGEAITAGTLFWIDDGVDTGDILDQHFFHIPPDETVGSLYRRHMAALETMMDRTLLAMGSGTIRRDPQDHECATWVARRTAKDGQIDWTAHADDVARLIRAVGRPYPGAFTHAGASKVHLWAARPFMQGDRHLAAPGQIITICEGGGIVVKCGGGSALHVTEWTADEPQRVRLHRLLGDAA